ncbi:ABC transporter [Clostridium carboxidivorans P7]|uniref:ABC transporter related protein n=1 Tax=Clostridium carboxidivorans P7 TaxID=536227 RepID=C6PRA0_9CLOT|nr:ATP-binding cassette domain-containing protein [Clostridium carboxidivorans]AKN31729.1 ABC transporter [Clostridium carboxidivorans P7]EET88200.1 ABC transporter related protein [Clostridium carboxidivorans P7]EFG87446.1 ABC transporter, ATP-binding protein [Clostridium carboxidivorans P7]
MLNVRIFKKMYCFDLDVNFSLNKEVLVIQGHSGSGKTTILDCISGIKTPEEGEISVGNEAIFSSKKNINMKIKDRNIGYVFQNYALFPHMTIEKNILFGLECKNLKDTNYIEHIMKVFNIDHLKRRYPKQISGGEKQRVALARALSIKPDVLLLDEPFSALDVQTKSIVYEEFLQLKKLYSIDIILVTHNPEEARLLGDKIIHIDYGRIKECKNTPTLEASVSI